jgi:hypothetical protein
MALPFMLSDESLTVQFIDGTCKTVSARSPHFHGILEAIKKNRTETEVKSLFSLAEAVKTFSQGAVTIKGDDVIFNGEVIKNSVADRILKFMSNGLPWQPLAKFLENLMANPSRRAVEYLYNFLEYENLAITEDGHFLAYKAVTNQYLDKHSGKFLNLPGMVLSMQRNQVCDDPDLGCSYGFHVGSLQYVRDFACNYGSEGGDRILVVKVNPADVVSVPHDCAYQKVRTAKYLVVAEYTGPLPEYVPNSCDALREIDEIDCNFDDEEDDDRDFDGLHVTVKPGQTVIVAAEKGFKEQYTFESRTKDGHLASRYVTSDWGDLTLKDKVTSAEAADLIVKITDQDGVDLTEEFIDYYLS